MSQLSSTVLPDANTQQHNSVHQKRYRLCITTGEPAGIGPDILLQLCAAWHQDNSLLPSTIELIYIGDPAILEQRAKQLKISVDLQQAMPNQPEPAFQQPATSAAFKLTYYAVSGFDQVSAGILNPANGRYVLNTLKAALVLCQLPDHHPDKCHALITGPIHKGVINEAGIAFSGHTGWLEQQTKACGSVMLLINQQMRVALTTVHIPLRAVADTLTDALLTRTLRILHTALRQQFGIDSPHIIVCGLNPHAGEEGHLGREELDIIIPCLERLRKSGMQLTGPLAADTAFISKHLETADAFLTHYHDQGLPVLKHSGFESAVNVTLGLPIIRTSVDHGTALDLAGSGQASFGSLKMAILTAAQMCNRTTQDNA